MINLPEPLVPAACDLRDFSFMPLDVLLLRDSSFAKRASGDEFRAAVMLWCAAWHQIPAGSLPDDDNELSALAGYGFAVKAWRKIRVGALFKFIKCRDGRLYHPEIAKKANNAWNEKLSFRWRRECDRIRKQNKRHGTETPEPDFETWKCSAGASGSMTGLAGADDRADGEDEAAPPADLSGGQERAVPPDNMDLSAGQHRPVHAEKPLKGQVRERERKKEEGSLRSPAARGTRLPLDWKPSEADRAFAVDLCLTVNAVAANFRDYWRSVAGQKGRKLDWSATWRNRCRDVAERACAKGRGSNWRGDVAEDNARRLAELNAQLNEEPPEDLFAGPTIDGTFEDV